jgi:hypothetical protein
VPAQRIFTDPLHLLAYGSDASFYRLIPKAVVKVHSEEEVRALLRLAAREQVPLTFRAAGTSLSGQAVTDSILIKVCACVRACVHACVPACVRAFLCVAACVCVCVCVCVFVLLRGCEPARVASLWPLCVRVFGWVAAAAAAAWHRLRRWRLLCLLCLL